MHKHYLSPSKGVLDQSLSQAIFVVRALVVILDHLQPRPARLPTFASKAGVGSRLQHLRFLQAPQPSMVPWNTNVDNYLKTQRKETFCCVGACDGKPHGYSKEASLCGP